jgi:hypothetical protein
MLDRPCVIHSHRRSGPVGDDSMHEKRERTGRVSPWTAADRGRSVDRPNRQRWRVRGSEVSGALRACVPRGQGARSKGAAWQTPVRAARAGRTAGSWPGQQARTALWIGGWGRHPLGFTGRRQKRLNRAGGWCSPMAGNVSVFCPENLLVGSFFVCSATSGCRPRRHLGTVPAARFEASHHLVAGPRGPGRHALHSVRCSATAKL